MFKTSLNTVSLLIVTSATDLPSTAPEGSLNVNVNVSGPSAVSSFVTGTTIVPVEDPAAIVRVPEVLV